LMSPHDEKRDLLIDGKQNGERKDRRNTLKKKPGDRKKKGESIRSKREE